MNIREEHLDEYGYNTMFKTNENYLKMLFGSEESLMSFDTYQFNDYSKVVADRFDADKKAKRRDEIFPIDCQRAFEMGSRFTHDF